MPTCVNGNLLISANPCLGQTTLNPNQQKLLKIWFMVLELAANGGTDYSNVLASTLLTDANSYAQNLDPSQKVTADLVLDYNNAVAAGASVSASINTLMGSIAPLSKVNDWDLDEMILLLKCKLGTHRNPPA